MVTHDVGCGLDIGSGFSHPCRKRMPQHMVVNRREGGKTVYRALALDLFVDRYRNPVQLVVELLDVVQIAVAVKKYEVRITADTDFAAYSA